MRGDGWNSSSSSRFQEREKERKKKYKRKNMKLEYSNRAATALHALDANNARVEQSRPCQIFSPARSRIYVRKHCCWYARSIENLKKKGTSPMLFNSLKTARC